MQPRSQVNSLTAVLPSVPVAPGVDPREVVLASLKSAMEAVIGKIQAFGDAAPLTQFEELACCLTKGVGFRADLDPIRGEYRISLKSPCRVYIRGRKVHVERLMPRA